jgi:dienelactone hydrolase
MLVDLVQVTTRDGLRLDGVFQAPAAGRSPGIPVDAFCLLHGTGGSFYSSTLLEAFAERLLELGCTVLRVNTRGHDGISTASTAKGGRRQGAAYEVVDDCRHDIAAWIDWLRQRTGSRIGLLGHSSGAVKAIYAVAHEPQLSVACLVALSPPRISYSWFCSSPEGPSFLEEFAAADRLASAARPTALLDVKLPLPIVMTAAGYLEKYGPDERYNFLRFLGAVPCPVLVTLGGIEVGNNMAFRGLPEALHDLAGRSTHLHVEMVEGADHFYSGVRDEVVDRVARWLRLAGVAE